MEIKLRNVSFEDSLFDVTHNFKKGKINCIIGSSGSGKTILSYLLIGLLFPDAGEILIDNNLLTKKNIEEIRKNIGYVFQNTEDSFIGLTVKEELEYSLKNNIKRYNNKDKIIRQAIEMFDLDNSILDKEINTLSSGELEKIAIVSSYILNPKVLILDEPTVNLDNKSEKKLIRFLKKLSKDYNKTIIVISNNIEFVYKISDDILFLNNGKKVKNNNYNTLIRNNMEVPKILEFINYVNKKKKININDTDNINDLIKEIIDYVS